MRHLSLFSNKNKKIKDKLHIKKENEDFSINKMVDMVIQNRNEYNIDKRRSLSSQNARIETKKKKTFCEYKNSRSRHDLTPNNNARLSTAKNVRKLMSPSEARKPNLNNIDYQLPQLKNCK